MTDNPEYKAYSIKNIEEWLSDAMESGCTPNEIYSSMVDCGTPLLYDLSNSPTSIPPSSSSRTSIN